MDGKLTERQLKALRAFNDISRGTFDTVHLAGPHKAGVRALIMSDLRGFRVPQSASGITAIREELFSLSQVEGSCLAVREDNLRLWALAQLGIQAEAR